MPDSLDTVELAMALEELEEGGSDLELSTSESEAMEQLLCSPCRLSWSPPDDSAAWPEKVLVFGRQDLRVLFHAGLPNAFGVGCLSNNVVFKSCVYPSLSRALFAFRSHTC
jgi:hypothetical protein